MYTIHIILTMMGTFPPFGFSHRLKHSLLNHKCKKKYKKISMQSYNEPISKKREHYYENCNYAT